MSNEWKDLGTNEDPLSFFTEIISLGLVSLERDHSVKNEETGETRTVSIQPGQSVGEAISKGQWSDR